MIYIKKYTNKHCFGGEKNPSEKQNKTLYHFENAAWLLWFPFGLGHGSEAQQHLMPLLLSSMFEQTHTHTHARTQTHTPALCVSDHPLFPGTSGPASSSHSDLLQRALPQTCTNQLSWKRKVDILKTVFVCVCVCVCVCCLYLVLYDLVTCCFLT